MPGNQRGAGVLQDWRFALPLACLLLWAHLLQREADPGRERRFLGSFRYYRDWHLAQRRLAFVPWHTQAYFLEWQRTGNPELCDWIFAMNDWLLGMQARSRVGYDDTLGRFYGPHNPGFGPPHASSTGVYLEDLADAYRLALACADRARQAAYREAVRGGLHSAMQLQFHDDATSRYVSDPERVAGGLRTTVYNNVIRVDNVQHTLLAALKILAVAGAQASPAAGGRAEEPLLPAAAPGTP